MQGQKLEWQERPSQRAWSLLYLMNSNEAGKQGCLYGEMGKDIKIDITLAQQGKAWKMAKTFSVCITIKENLLIVSHKT